MGKDSAMLAPTLKRRIKVLGKQGFRTIFELGQYLGVDILPRHYYSEIPDVSDLRGDGHWKEPRSMIGVTGTAIPDQLRFVCECCPPTVVDRLRSADIHAHGCAANGAPGFGLVEADFLYAFIATHRPQKIVQVGCGVSTAIILLAAAEVGYSPEILCIEPYPTEFLRQADRERRLALIVERAQRVPLELLTGLGTGGLLFVDSTHTVKPGSEVNLLILEVLPRLQCGVSVHFHDIFFPYDYQRGLLTDELFFCNESVLLHAFLTNNPRFTIRASLSMLHYAAPDELREFLPNYQSAGNEHGLNRSEGHFPASTYLEVVA
jgi:hypothetical protein